MKRSKSRPLASVRRPRAQPRDAPYVRFVASYVFFLPRLRSVKSDGKLSRAFNTCGVDNVLNNAEKIPPRH